jgi:hypothetical protein
VSDEEIEEIVAELQSAGKLAKLLVKLGVEPPMKESARTKQMTYAFSQQDESFMALAAHEDERVRDLIAGAPGGEEHHRRDPRAAVDAAPATA